MQRTEVGWQCARTLGKLSSENRGILQNRWQSPGHEAATMHVFHIQHDPMQQTGCS
jgi:hypothetical protein